MITTLSSDLTTPVPEALVELLNLHPGSQLDWQMDGANQRIVIDVAVVSDRLTLLRQLREMGRKHKRPGQDAVADLIRERVEEDQMREDVLK